VFFLFLRGSGEGKGDMIHSMGYKSSAIAFTGAAVAAIGDAETIHSSFSIAIKSGSARKSTVHVSDQDLGCGDASDVPLNRLKTDKLLLLRQQLRDVKFLFIDEVHVHVLCMSRGSLWRSICVCHVFTFACVQISMVPPTLLAKIHLRLQEILANDLDFGGLHVIASGDFTQVRARLCESVRYVCRCTFDSIRTSEIC
jgi:hypothetical protein